MATSSAKLKLLPLAEERRRHQRVTVNLLGRYMLSDRREYPCQVTNMSPGGMALIAPTIGHVGERVIAYVDHLGRLEGSDVHFIDSVESNRALRVGGRLGRSMPAHCTSTGKALLSMLSEDELLRLYPDEELPRLTPNSIGTRTELVKALGDIRARGFARSREESEEGVTSVAVPLRATRSPRLAVNVSVPVSRMTDAVEEVILGRLTAAAEELDHLLL